MKILIIFFLLVTPCYAQGLFPTTPILDDFDRANTGPPPSADWSDAIGLGFDQLKVVDNECVGADVSHLTFAQDYWNVLTFGPDVEGYVEIDTIVDDTDYVHMILRTTSIPSTQPDGYICAFVNNTGGDDHFRMFRVDNGAGTQLGADRDDELTNGDYLGCSVIGDRIRIFFKDSGTWLHLGSEEDATYSTAGHIALKIDELDTDLDNFGGGTFKRRALTQ